MKVSELIELLKEQDQDDIVQMWSEFGDVNLKEVSKSDINDDAVLLS